MDLVNSPGAKQTSRQDFHSWSRSPGGPPAQRPWGSHRHGPGALSQKPAGSCRASRSSRRLPTQRRPQGPGRDSGEQPRERLPVFWALTKATLLVSGCRRMKPHSGAWACVCRVEGAEPGPGKRQWSPSTGAQQSTCRRLSPHPADVRRHTEQTA